MAELKEVKVDEGGREEYIPLKERPLDEASLKPKLEVFPAMFPELRNKLYKWYPGPEIMMHKMHWTEWIFVIFLASAILLLVLVSDDMPSYVYGFLLALVSLIALVFVWGFAKYKSLADAAEKLEQIAMANHAEVGAYVEINDEWERSLQDSQANLTEFTSSMGLVSSDADEISKLTDALGGLVKQKKIIQAEEMALFQVSVRHQKVTRAEIDEKDRTNTKRKLGRLYDRIARKDKSAGEGHLVDAPLEIDELRKAMQADTFLNQTKENSDEPMFTWLPEFEQIASDGTVNKWELLDMLDKVTNSYFLEIKDAIKTKASLEKELAQVKAKTSR